MCQCGISVCIFCRLFCEGQESVCADGGGNNGGLSGQPAAAAGVGLNVPVCLGGPNGHSDACVAPLQSASYLFILESTQRHHRVFFMDVKWPFFNCCRDRRSCRLTGTLPCRQAASTISSVDEGATNIRVTAKGAPRVPAQ